MQREREAFATLRVAIVVVGGGLTASYALNKVEQMIILRKALIEEDEAKPIHDKAANGKSNAS